MSAEPAPLDRLPRRVDILTSYHYFRRDDMMSALLQHDRLRIIADSGAFSAFTQGTTIELAEYAAWIKRWRHHLFWAASLDVFGDPTATLANFRTLRDHHGLATVPTLHIGADPAHLDVYAAEGVDFLGLGGMVGMPRNAILRWLVHVLRYARDHHPHLRFHAWGMSTQSYLEKLPLYSVDSSGLLTKAPKFGNLSLWHPRLRQMVSMVLDGRGPLQHRRLLVETYRTPPSAILRSHKGNRQLLIQLAAYSAHLRAQYLQARHQVTPPTWGINPAETDPIIGTRVHLVSQAQDYHDMLAPLPAPAGAP